MRFKKLAWRFSRGVVYVFLSGLAATYLPTFGIGEEGATAIVSGLLLAVDKALGVGALVSTSAK